MDRIKPFEPLFGEWYAQEFLGEGSFGRVYRAGRTVLDSTFYSAVKHIPIPAGKGEEDALRDVGLGGKSLSDYYNSITKEIMAEIEIMNRLKGQTNVVSIEDSRVIPRKDGVGCDVFIRMELLENLAKFCKTREFGERDAIKLGVDICTALELCEKNGIIHRDVKPGNIFINKNGDYKLGDFGIARSFDKTAAMSKKGTYNYMAPEIYNGRPYGANSDTYSLGLVLYRLLNNGRLPFFPPAHLPITPNDAETALVRRMRGDRMPPPCNASDELASIVLQACAYDPNERFASARAMRTALEAAEIKPSFKAPSMLPETGDAASNGKTTPIMYTTPNGNATRPERIALAGRIAPKDRIPPDDPAPQMEIERKAVTKGKAKIGNRTLIIIALALAAVLALLVALMLLKKAQDPGESLTPYPLPENSRDTRVEDNADLPTPSHSNSPTRRGIRVEDNADLLTPEQEEALARKLDVYSRKHDCDIVVITARSLGNKNAKLFAADYYEVSGYNMGGGIAMLVCPEERDYAFVGTGKCYGILNDSKVMDQLKDTVVDDHLKYDRYYDAFNAFADKCDEFLRNIVNAEQIIVIQPSFQTRSLNVEDSIRVYGTVPPGTRISISSNDPEFSLKSEPEIDEVGNFSFEVNMPTPAKSYKFLITARLEDGAVFERPFSVERPPVYSDYVPTVWPGNYEEMMKPIHITDMRGFYIKGTVGEIIYDGDYVVAEFLLDSGELIEIEYHDHYSTASDLQEGSHYTMYGYSLGTSVSPDGNLRLFIWFILD